MRNILMFIILLHVSYARHDKLITVVSAELFPLDFPFSSVIVEKPTDLPRPLTQYGSIFEDSASSSQYFLGGVVDRGGNAYCAEHTSGS